VFTVVVVSRRYGRAPRTRDASPVVVRPIVVLHFAVVIASFRRSLQQQRIEKIIDGTFLEEFSPNNLLKTLLLP
jgi:hypothetical protein